MGEILQNWGKLFKKGVKILENPSKWVETSGTDGEESGLWIHGGIEAGNDLRNHGVNQRWPKKISRTWKMQVLNEKLRKFYKFFSRNHLGDGWDLHMVELTSKILESTKEDPEELKNVEDAAVKWEIEEILWIFPPKPPWRWLRFPMGIHGGVKVGNYLENFRSQPKKIQKNSRTWKKQLLSERLRKFCEFLSQNHLGDGWALQWESMVEPL